MSDKLEKDELLKVIKLGLKLTCCQTLSTHEDIAEEILSNLLKNYCLKIKEKEQE